MSVDCWQDAKIIQWRKIVFWNNLSVKWCWANWISTCKRGNSLCYSTPYIKINSDWIENLNRRARTIKLLEEDIRVNVFDLEFDNGFLGLKPKPQATANILDFYRNGFWTYEKILTYSYSKRKNIKVVKCHFFLALVKNKKFDNMLYLVSAYTTDVYFI